MSPKEALAFVEKHGVVLQAARGSVPSLAEAVAGERIRGSWWGHPKGRDIYSAAEAVSESPDVLVCKLLEGKITYVHRRLWPALVKLASRFPKARLAKVWNEHTSSGAHRSRHVAFPTWVPADVTRQAEALPLSEAEVMLSQLPALGRERVKHEHTSRRTTGRGRRSPADDDGGRDGLRKETFRDGTLSAVGRYSKGKKSGSWKYYFRNGLLKATGTYSRGQLDGAWRWYRESGKPLQAGRFKGGKQVGLWKRYHESGRLYDVGKYVDGEKVGVWKYYDKHAKLSRTRDHSTKA